MSEITKAVIQMPYELAMDGEVSRRQFYMRAQSMLAEKEAIQSLNAELLAALEHARLFIRNGVELGYIRMPDADTPDPAHETLPKIETAISKARSAQ